MCIFVYTYICIYMYIHVSIYAYVYMFIYMFITRIVFMDPRICIYIYIHIYINIIYIYLYIYIYIYIYINIYIYIYIYIFVCMCFNLFIRIQVFGITDFRLQNRYENGLKTVKSEFVALCKFVAILKLFLCVNGKKSFLLNKILHSVYTPFM
jgi:hypothetical protein